MKNSKYLLPLIVFAQFAGTSLWFAANAVIGEIQKNHSVSGSSANITSFVQFGFIAGTLVFSLFTIADRYSARKVFFYASLIAAAANLLLITIAENNFMLYSLRFITGFFLAGIYPVGMKIAADHFPEKLGNALGFLVGALVLGTAFPHLLKSELQRFDWKQVLIFTSALATAGGILVYVFVPSSKKIIRAGMDLNAAFSVFKSDGFRSLAFGYFGHMWELYTFWAFVPLMILHYNHTQSFRLDVSLWSFLVIATGCAGCISGGILSKKTGSKKVAFYSLLVSGICCALSPWAFYFSKAVFLFFLLVWGFFVVADSPQFSALVARSARPEKKGTALTIVTCIGFAITILSVQCLRFLYETAGVMSFLLLLPGPLFGLIALKRPGNIS